MGKKKKPMTDNRTKRAFNFWADPKLADALDEYMASMDVPTKYTAHLEIALREYLERRGRWPPKPANQSGAERRSRTKEPVS